MAFSIQKFHCFGVVNFCTLRIKGQSVVTSVPSVKALVTGDQDLSSNQDAFYSESSDQGVCKSGDQSPLMSVLVTQEFIFYFLQSTIKAFYRQNKVIKAKFRQSKFLISVVVAIPCELKALSGWFAISDQ